MSTQVPIPLPALPARPLVSVLVASYNYAPYVETAVESVLAQTYPHVEAIVCDDGSTDGSGEIVARMARRDPRVRLIRKANGGVASALNAAFAASRGDILCLLDADDFFMPGKVEAVVGCFRARPATGFVAHAMQVVDGAGRPLDVIPAVRGPEAGWIADQVRRRGGRWRNMPASALAFRRALADHLFPLPEPPLRREADGYLFTLAPLLTPVGFVGRALSGYRLHGANLTGTTRIDAASVARQLDALERINATANARLAALGLRGLDLRRHLNYREGRYARALFDRDAWPVRLAEARRLYAALLADDLYGLPRKLLGAVAYAVATGLPPRLRAGWLTAVLGQQAWRPRRPAQADASGSGGRPAATDVRM